MRKIIVILLLAYMLGGCIQKLKSDYILRNYDGDFALKVDTLLSKGDLEALRKLGYGHILSDNEYYGDILAKAPTVRQLIDIYPEYFI